MTLYLVRTSRKKDQMGLGRMEPAFNRLPGEKRIDLPITQHLDMTDLSPIFGT